MMCGSGQCCSEESDGRRFLTKDEKLEKLEDYKKWLDNESKGVKEAMDKLKKA